MNNDKIWNNYMCAFAAEDEDGDVPRSALNKTLRKMKN